MQKLKTIRRHSSPAVRIPGQGYWQRDRVYNPEPVMPMWRSVFIHPYNLGCQAAYREFGFRGNQMYRDIGGWAYLGNITANLNVPGWLVPLVRRAMNSRLKGFLTMVRDCQEVRFLRIWSQEWQPRQKAAISELLVVDLAALGDAQLEKHLSSVLMPFLIQSVNCQVILEFAFVISMARLAFLCQTLLNWDDRRIISLLSGLSTSTTAASIEIHKLAAIVRGKPPVYALFNHQETPGLAEFLAADADFRAAFQLYLKENGCHLLSSAIHTPTLIENPDCLLGLVRDSLRSGCDLPGIALDLAKKRLEAVSQAQEALQQRSVLEREFFEKALSGAQQIYPLKEASEYETMDAPLALMRYALLDLGKRAVLNGHLEKAGDVFFLEFEETLEGFRHGRDWRELIRQRQAERAWVESHPGPASYGKPPSVPPALLSQELRIILQGSQWVMEQYYAFNSQPHNVFPKTLRGTPAAPGTYRGPACIVMNAVDFDKLRSGDVLVCPITTPAWTLLFPKIGAIVTDAGGILSHPAIIAREYGIPAVVATGNATTRLKDGQVVFVDGGNGIIEIE
jgi:rifampicin phosphotransferase